MSHDCELRDPVTGTALELDAPHHMRGGTYALGGTAEASLNVTYNYGALFSRVPGEGGLRGLRGMTGADSLPVLRRAAAALGDDVDPDYWKPTEGNDRPFPGFRGKPGKAPGQTRAAGARRPGGDAAGRGVGGGLTAS